jgi:hypothetical protein
MPFSVYLDSYRNEYGAGKDTTPATGFQSLLLEAGENRLKVKAYPAGISTGALSPGDDSSIILRLS